MAGNKIELWGRLLGEPERRTTPAGTSVLRMTVDAAEEPGALALAVTMTGEAAANLGAGLRGGANVRVAGSLKAVHRRLNSGLFETGYEVKADSITIESSRTIEPSRREN